MLDDRNKSSHIYDEKTSEEIFKRIKEVYAGKIEEIIKTLPTKL